MKIQKVLASLWPRVVSDPRLLPLHITSVEVTDNLRRAHIYYTAADSGLLEEVAVPLDKARGYLRCVLADHTALRRVPELFFREDVLVEQTARLSELMRSKEFGVDAHHNAD